VIAVLRRVVNTWRAPAVNAIALGKYVVLLASVLHLMWAALLVVDSAAERSTPVHIVSLVFGGPTRTAVVLVVVATLAMIFPFLRHRVTNHALALMLIPQQMVLLLSAGNGIRATAISHYADGVGRPWAFILADQLPVILLAVLYSVAVLEAAFEER
jgi:hypothetical protein